MKGRTSPDYQVDSAALCYGIHFVILDKDRFIIECSYCDETDSVLHSGETYQASLGGLWIAKAAEHLAVNHPTQMGMLGL